MYGSPLDKIKVATPCQADWQLMYGNDRVRFCSQCNQNVYNLSAMSCQEAENLILRTEGRLCARFYRRKDGTILTANCSVGLRALKDRTHRLMTHIVGALLSLLSFFGLVGMDRFASRSQGFIQGAITAPAKQKYPIEHRGSSVTTGQLSLQPKSVQRTESFIRDKAVNKVIPIYHGAGQIKGDATVKIIIFPHGDVYTATFINGNPLVKEQVEVAASQWKFEPMLSNGQPVMVESVLTFHFRQ